MLNNVLIALVLSGLCSSGFALDVNDGTTVIKSEYNTSFRTHILTKHQIIEGFDAGISAGATHMLIVWDTYDYENSYNFIVYCHSGEDVNELINSYDAPGYSRVSAVLAMHLDVNQQLSEKRWYPDYP